MYILQLYRYNKDNDTKISQKYMACLIKVKHSLNFLLIYMHLSEIFQDYIVL